MKKQLLKRLSKGLAPPVLALLVVALGSGIAYALTPAGTTITNSATVDYQDGFGNTFSATSEDATVDVGSVYDATIEQDELAVVSAPNNTKNISFTVTNLSNTAETFTVQFGDNNDNGTGNTEPENADSDLLDNIDAAAYTLFLDSNGNGLADSGEPILTSWDGVSAVVASNQFSLAGNTGGNNIANLVLQVQVPATAVNGDEIGSILTVTGNNVTTVTDLTTSKGADGLDNTVQSLVTISADAVLDINKSAVLDAANNRITYTLNISNNGAADAEDIRIVDRIPALTTFEAMTAINLSTAQGDAYWDGDSYEVMTVGTTGPFLYDTTANGTPDTAITEQLITEPTGVDLNDDGITGGTFTGIEFKRAVLTPASSVSIKYSVTYNPNTAAGTNIVNTFCVQGDLDENNSTGVNVPGDTLGRETEICSNTTTTPIPVIYGVDADDTDGNRVGGAPSVAGEYDTATIGDDEDFVDNDNQYEHTAAAGEVVRFSNVITNTGNAADSFNLSINSAASTFPNGTTFAFFIGGSSIGSNTGTIAAGASVTITVRATLPGLITDGMATLNGGTVEFDPVAGVFFYDVNSNGTWDADGLDDDIGTIADNENFIATLTATSANDPAGSPASDTKTESLGAIRQGVVDLANSSFLGAEGSFDVDVNEDWVGDTNITGAGTTFTGDGVATATPGPLNPIDDGDAIADASLNSLLGVDSGTPGVSDIITTSTAAPGDTVIFPLYIANESGSSTSYTLSVDATMTSIPAGWSVVFRPLGGGAAFVSTPTAVPEGSQYALQAEVTIPTNVAQAAAGSYDFAFKVVSNSNSNVKDIKIDRINVSAVCNINEGSGATDQLGPNGTVFYTHTIKNDGNQAQTFNLKVATSVVSAGTNGSTGWTANMELDTNDDGVTDTDYANLTAGVSTIYILNASGSREAQVLGGSGANKTITLDPGETLPLRVRVFAPSTADFNDKIRATITIDDQDGNTTADNGACEIASIIDDTTVALNVRIDKTVAVDPSCTCEENGAGVTPFAKNNSTLVRPGECLIWQLTVTNDGTLPASNVVVSDEITPFSTALPTAPGSTHISVTSGAVFGASNPSGVTGVAVTAPETTQAQEYDLVAYQVCHSENDIGGLCSTAGNIKSATGYEEGSMPAAANLVEVSGTSVTFYVGAGADGSTSGDGAAGGTLIGSDSAVGQFCVQVQ